MFKVKVDPETLVKGLKELIEKEHGKDYPQGSQKLIYSGKILADDNKLSEYNIDEKKFVVLMITRPPPVPKLAQAAQTATTPTTTTTTTASAVSDRTATNVTNATTNQASSNISSSESTAPLNPATASQPTTRQQPSSNNNSSSGNNNNPSTNNNNTITNNNNSSTSTNPQAPASTNQNPPSVARPAFEDPTMGVGEPQVSARLAALMAQPQFVAIQELIQQSPHLLSTAIDNLATTEPEFYNFISENPDIFVNALNGPIAARPTSGSGRQSQGSDRARQGARRTRIIEVSERDKQAIERLKELGFSEVAAYEAYMACDKDEQLAANLLFQMEQ